MKSLIQVPNITLASKVTLLRILSVPLFILLTLYYTMSLTAGEPRVYCRHVALALFVLIAVTDAVDGYLARSRNEVTKLGKLLDPIADKLLLLSAVIMWTRPGIPELQPQFPVAFTLLVISRDMLLIAGAFVIYGMTNEVQVAPRWTGKVATALLMAAAAWAIAGFAREPFLVLVWIDAVFIFVSGLHYVLDGVRQFEQEHE